MKYILLLWLAALAVAPLLNADQTATFDNGQVMDGNDPYVVNFVQYVKKGSDKFMLMFTQYPKAAMAEHADNPEAVIKSLKLR